MFQSSNTFHNFASNLSLDDFLPSVSDTLLPPSTQHSCSEGPSTMNTKKRYFNPDVARVKPTKTLPAILSSTIVPRTILPKPLSNHSSMNDQDRLEHSPSLQTSRKDLGAKGKRQQRGIPAENCFTFSIQMPQKDTSANGGKLRKRKQRSNNTCFRCQQLSIKVNRSKTLLLYLY
jgi:hypothetical protein